MKDTSKLQCKTTVSVNREDMKALWSQKKCVAVISRDIVYRNTGCRVFNGVYKIGKIFAWKSTYPKEIIEIWELVYWVGVKKCPHFCLSKSIFSVKNCLNLSQLFFIKKYQLRSTFFVINIFWQHFITKMMSEFWQLTTTQILKLQ